MGQVTTSVSKDLGEAVATASVDEIESLGHAIRSGDVGALVERIRSSAYGVTDFLRDVQRLKDELADVVEPRAALERWRCIDAAVARTLGRTSAVHEVVLERSLRGYAEVDSAGVVVYANPALLRLDDAVVGTRLADCFGAGGREDVENALVHGSSLMRLEFEAGSGGDGTTIPVSAEFGPVVIDGERVAGYAILVDLRIHDRAALQTLDAAPFGAFRLDRHGRISFANRQASVELGGVDTAALQGRALTDLLRGEGESLSRALADEATERGGISQQVTFKRPQVPVSANTTRDDIPIILSVFPEFDASQRRVGSYATFRSRALDAARRRIREACLQTSDPLETVGTLLREVQSFVPFTAATFGILDQGRTHCRVLAAEPRFEAMQTGYTPGRPVRARWLEIPEALRSWIDGEETWEADLEAFWDRYPNAAPLRCSALSQELMESGAKSFISMTDLRQETRTAFLSLLSTERGAYGRAEHDRLRELGIEQALDILHKGLRRQRKDRTRELMQKLASVKTQSHQKLAQLLCEHVASVFGWEHVSIFKVNRIRSRFELLEQFDRTGGDFTLPQGYTQPFERITDGVARPYGMLGHALKAGLQILADSRGAEGEGYVRKLEHACSALCKPITLDGTVAWILNAESRDTHTFFGPDLGTLDRMIEALQSTLDGLFQSRLVHRALDLAEQGIVITDAEGRVRHASREAEQMLAISLGELRQLKRWSDLLASDEDREALLSPGPGGARSGCFRIGTGEIRRFQVSRKGFGGEEYDHELWVLTDPSRTTEQVEMSYLTRTVAEVAQLSRLPLTIATHLLKRVVGTGSDGEISDIAAKAVQLIAKADITYQRLATGMQYRKDHVRHETVALKPLVRTIVEELPKADRDRVMLTLPDEPTPVRADGSQLAFMLRSLLFYLLRVASVNAKVTIIVKEDQRGIWLALGLSERVEGTGVAPAPDDWVSRAEEVASLAAELAPDAVRRIAGEHGELLAFVTEPPEPRFELLLHPHSER